MRVQKTRKSSMQHPIPVTLSETDRASLQTFIHTGKASARVFARAYALLKAAEGWTDAQIYEAFGISRNTSIKVRRTYLEGGLVVRSMQRGHLWRGANARFCGLTSPSETCVGCMVSWTTASRCSVKCSRSTSCCRVALKAATT